MLCAVVGVPVDGSLRRRDRSVPRDVPFCSTNLARASTMGHRTRFPLWQAVQRGEINLDSSKVISANH